MILAVSAQKISAQQSSTIPAEVQKLDKFLGSWKGTLTDIHQKEQTQVTAQITFKPVAGGWGLYAEELDSDPKSGELKGVDLMGYDPYAKKLHCYTVDNTGTTHDHLCTWKSDNVFYMEHNSMRDGKSYQEKITCTFKGKDQIDFKLETFIGGQLDETLAGLYNRSSQ